MVTGCTAQGLNRVHHLINGLERRETHGNVLIYMAVIVMK